MFIIFSNFTTMSHRQELSAMKTLCNAIGLECWVVEGTYLDSPWYWNIVLDDGYYYHVDLLESLSQGNLHPMTDAEMVDYVWDYSAYPTCTGEPPEENPTAPPEKISPQATVVLKPL